ncbi:MAG TPA: GntR family transcriptional regulator [Solirubrobacteraceae bacterium]|nr:GntR family transcriptional regulator [Solirubrobacteraceae bacterium]
MTRPPTLVLGSVRDELKSDRVAAELERRILCGELAPGDRLPTEPELGQMLGVSRSVVRDAIRSLVARGLVTVRQGQGTTVAAPSDATFAHALIALLARSELTMGDVVDARAAIECSLVPMAAETVTAEDLAALELAQDAFAAAVIDGDWARARESHLQLHLGLLDALHRPALQLFLKPMTEIIVISSAPPRLGSREDWEVETHPPIIDGLRARDPEAVRAAMAAYFRRLEGTRYEEFRALSFRAVFAEIPWARP